MRCFTEEFIKYTVAIITGENNPRYSELYAFYCKLTKKKDVPSWCYHAVFDVQS